MSPEQACGLELDHRSDIFSFGVVLYEMATGALPFQGTQTAEVLSEIASGNVRPLRSLRRDLPPDFERIVAKALQKERQNRYQHAEEMLDNLRALRGAIERRAPVCSLLETRTIVELPAAGVN